MKTFIFTNDDGEVLDCVEAESHDEAVANARDGIEYNTCYEEEDELLNFLSNKQYGKN